MDKFNIQIVSQITGISAHTLRAWEKRYQIIQPDRNETGRRLYSQHEIDKLQVIKTLIEAGNTIGALVKLTHATRLEMLNSIELNSTAIFNQHNSIQSDIDCDLVLKNILMALNNYKLDIISHEFDKCITQISSRDFAFKIIIPLFRTVGDMIFANKFSTAQEHAISAITTFYIGKLITAQYKVPKKSRYKICLATPKGELHSFGILIAGLLCHHYHIDFIYLGEDMPSASIVETIKAVSATHLILGVMKQSHKYAQYQLSDYLNDITQDKTNSFETWIGGPSDEIAAFQLKGHNIFAIDNFQDLEVKIKRLSNN